MYFSEAQDKCKSKGGNLVQIRDSLTQAFIIYTLRSLSWNRNGVWIGATDRDREGEWKWVTGDKLLYSKWSKGHPNCEWMCETDCAVLWLKDGGRWRNKHCDFSFYHYSYICQYQMTPLPRWTTVKTSKPITSTATANPTTTTTKSSTTKSSPTTTTRSTTTIPTTTTSRTTTITTQLPSTTFSTSTKHTTDSSTFKPPVTTINISSKLKTIMQSTKSYRAKINLKHNRLKDAEYTASNNNQRTSYGESYKPNSVQPDRMSLTHKLPPKGQQEDHVNHGLWIGCIAGGVTLLGLLLVVFVIIFKKRKTDREGGMYTATFQNPSYGQTKDQSTMNNDHDYYNEYNDYNEVDDNKVRFSYGSSSDAGTTVPDARSLALPRL